MSIATIQSGFRKTGIYPFNRHAIKIETRRTSAAFGDVIPSTTISGPISNHPLAAVANLPAHITDILLTPETSSKKSSRMIVKERVLTDDEWKKKIEEKEKEIAEKERKKNEMKERKRKKEEEKRKKAEDVMRRKEQKRKEKEEKKQEIEKRKKRRAEKKRLREFHEKMVIDYQEDTEDVSELSPPQSPCCSKDETKSSKRQLWAPTPETKRKRISKRPSKKRFIIDYDDYQSSDVNSISDICFACQHASLPSGVFRESIQWISCKKCSLWYHKYCCNMEFDNADFTCKDCISFAIELEV